MGGGGLAVNGGGILDFKKIKLPRNWDRFLSLDVRGKQKTTDFLEFKN